MAFPIQDFDSDDMSDSHKWSNISDAISFAIVNGLGQTFTRETLRNSGYRFGNTEFSRLWLSQFDINADFTYSSTLPLTVIPDPSRFATVDYLVEGRYQYIVSWDYYNVATDNVENQRFAIVTADILSRQQLQDIAIVMSYIISPLLGENIANLVYHGASRGTL